MTRSKETWLTASPGTPFEALPDEWECPRCGVSKNLFEEIREGSH